MRTPSSTELNGTAVATFHIGRYEVTWGEWKEVRDSASANGYDIEWTAISVR